MVGESYFISLTSGVHNKVVVEVKQKAAHVFVVNFSSAVSLVLGYYLSTVFPDELILFTRLLDINSPAGYIRRGE